MTDELEWQPDSVAIRAGRDDNGRGHYHDSRCASHNDRCGCDHGGGRGRHHVISPRAV